MNKKWIVGLGFIFIGALFYGFQKGNKGSEISSHQDDLRLRNKKAVSEVIESPRDPIVPPQANLTPECKTFFGNLRALDLKGEKTLSAITEHQCQKVPEALTSLHSFFESQCKGKTESKNCLLAIYHYRAALTDFFTRDLPLSEIRDPRVLFDKMVANRSVAPEISLKAAERLVELKPDLYEAYKVQILQNLFIASQNPQGNSVDWNKLETVLEKASVLNSQDPELLEAEMMVHLFRSSDPKNLQDRAKQITEDYPQDWRGPYYLAWGLFNEGRGQEAVEYLMEAKRRDQANPKIDKALEGVKNGKAKPFEAGLSFSDSNLAAD